MQVQESAARDGDTRMDIDGAGDESGDERQAVVLESDSETYLVAPGLDPSEGYVLYVLLPAPSTDVKGPSINEQLVDDKNIPTTAPAPKTPRVESSAGSRATPTPTSAIETDVSKDDKQTPVPDPQAEPHLSSPPPPLPYSSVPPPPAKTLPRGNHTKMLRSNLKDENFKFEQDSVIMCARGEATGVRVKVVRWRWHI